MADSKILFFKSKMVFHASQPSLPDEIPRMDLVFREYSASFREKPTGIEIAMNIE